jgi:ArsR family transcriptional regulator
MQSQYAPAILRHTWSLFEHRGGRFVVSLSAVRDEKRTARLFHALSDETRLRIIEQLADGEQCVCDLSGALETGQSRLSFHLKTLKDAGLLRDRREGRWIYYALDPGTLSELRDFVETIGGRQGRNLRIRSRCCE